MTQSGDDEVFQLIYRSRSVLTGSDASIDAEVNALSQRAAAHNLHAGVTGALMFTTSAFLQVLEGRSVDLENTFERICCDLRHTNVELISFSQVSERTFNNWTLRRVHAGTSLETILCPLNSVATNEAHATPLSIKQAVAQLAVNFGQSC